ncbi:GTP pyrophosphokinase family protein [Candidatus Saccharibacteria bacterium]|nr:GTP pyrophosphokinase family protein [Candidatus Saccharibacteria bacterium]
MDFETIDLEKEFNKLLVQRRCGLRNVLQRIENIRDVIEHDDSECACIKDSPFDTIKHRMKSFDSTCEKIRRKGWEMNTASLEKVHDIAGIRIIAPYQSDVYEIRDILYDVVKSAGDKPTMKIVEERDYIKNPKPSGYRSLHLLVEVRISATKGEKPKWIPVEIQIRTSSMDLWANYEHNLKYKNPNPSDETIRMFSNLANNLAQLDEELMKVRENNTKDIITAKQTSPKQ